MADCGYFKVFRERYTFVLETFGPDVLLLDLHLQRCAAYETTRIVTAYGPHVLQPMQTLTSYRELAKVLRQSEPMVRRRMKKLTGAGLARCEPLTVSIEKRRTHKTHPPTVVTIVNSAFESTRDEIVTHPSDAKTTERDAELRSRKEEGERESAADSTVCKVMDVHPGITAGTAADWLTLHDGDVEHLVTLLARYADQRIEYLDAVARNPKNKKREMAATADRRGPRRIEQATTYREAESSGPSVDDIRTLRFETTGGGEWSRNDSSREDGERYLREFALAIDESALHAIPKFDAWLSRNRGAA
ncbi:MAG: hypothetical protein WA208_21690 [Thermoanaerobaculia bacterium]